MKIHVTPAALHHLRKRMQRSPSPVGFCLSVEAGGCSGKLYALKEVHQPVPQAQSVVLDDVPFFVPEGDVPWLQGITLDLKQQGLNTALVFRNPNATATCGCGESFQVTP